MQCTVSSSLEPLAHSGATNAIRELGGVSGIAVLASVFSAYRGYASPRIFVDGLTPALWLGATVVGVGALTALLLPARRPVESYESTDDSLRAALERTA
jgi:hypothetical protein